MVRPCRIALTGDSGGLNSQVPLFRVAGKVGRHLVGGRRRPGGGHHHSAPDTSWSSWSPLTSTSRFERRRTCSGTQRTRVGFSHPQTRGVQLGRKTEVNKVQFQWIHKLAAAGHSHAKIASLTGSCLTPTAPNCPATQPRAPPARRASGAPRAEPMARPPAGSISYEDGARILGWSTKWILPNSSHRVSSLR